MGSERDKIQRNGPNLAWAVLLTRLLSGPLTKKKKGFYIGYNFTLLHFEN